MILKNIETDNELLNGIIDLIQENRLLKLEIERVGVEYESSCIEAIHLREELQELKNRINEAVVEGVKNDK